MNGFGQVNPGVNRGSQLSRNKVVIEESLRKLLQVRRKIPKTKRTISEIFSLSSNKGTQEEIEKFCCGAISDLFMFKKRYLKSLKK